MNKATVYVKLEFTAVCDEETARKIVQVDQPAATRAAMEAFRTLARAADASTGVFSVPSCGYLVFTKGDDDG